MDDNHMKGDLTVPVGDAPFGGSSVGTYSIDVKQGDFYYQKCTIRNDS